MGERYESSKCSLHQQGEVWFLPDVVQPGNTVEFYCQMPAGKSVLLPLSTSMCEYGSEPISDKLTPDPETDSSIKSCATKVTSTAKIDKVLVDNQPIELEETDRVTTDYFNITISEKPPEFFMPDMAPLAGGTFRAIADGYFLFLKPLSKGEHTIDFQVTERFENTFATRAGLYTVSVV